MVVQNANKRSLAWFAWVSAALALASCGVSYLDATSIQISMLTPAAHEFPFGVACSICVYLAYRAHGRRALWLLVGFPFAWSYVALLAVFVIAHTLAGGGV